MLADGDKIKKKGKIGRKKGLMKEDTLVTGRSDVNVPKRVKPVPFIFLSVCNVLHMVAVVAVGGPHVRPVDRPVFSCSRCVLIDGWRRICVAGVIFRWQLSLVVLVLRGG